MRLPRARTALLLGLTTLVSLVGLVAVPAPTASAATAGWADLSFEGRANDWTGTLRQRATGFPEATVASDSAAGSAVGRQSGSSTYLSASTPVGDVYGSSRGRPYLNLRPYTANGGGVPGVSTTTYTFAAPTPASGWTFVLGDVDADAVTVEATGAGGVPVDAEDLGFRSVFNYAGGSDVPRWDAGRATLTGNARALDTDGASAWFEPRVPLETLTFVFTRRAGFPVYQTWFAAQSHALSGTVDAPAGVREGLTVRLYASDGRVVGETTTDADGTYRFGDLATYDDYRVGLVRPDGYTSDKPLTQGVDLSRDDQVADFSLRAIVPVAVSGTVTDADEKPLGDLLVTLTGSGVDLKTQTEADGTYVFDDVRVGDGYELAVSPPRGFAEPAPLTVSVPPDSEEPIDGQDFRITRKPPAGTFAASGTVRDEAGMAFSDVKVEVSDGAGVLFGSATTDDTGAWSVDGLAADEDWAATVVPPDGYEAPDGDTLDFDATDATGLDFVLARETSGGGGDDGGSEPATGSSGGSGGTSATPVLAQTGGPGVALLLVGLGATTGGVLLLRRSRLRRG